MLPDLGLGLGKYPEEEQNAKNHGIILYQKNTTPWLWEGKPIEVSRNGDVTDVIKSHVHRAVFHILNPYNQTLR